MFTNTNVLNKFNALKNMKNAKKGEIVKISNPGQLAEIISGESVALLNKNDSIKSV